MDHCGLSEIGKIQFVSYVDSERNDFFASLYEYVTEEFYESIKVKYL